ncbi:MAG: hypothetical protein ACE5HD_06155 [Acidobacteriota bacterium]
MSRHPIALPSYPGAAAPGAGEMKPPEADDPMSLEAVGVEGGDVEAMAEAWVEEYARMGTSEETILHLFRRPFFRGTHLYYASRGEERTREMIHRVLARTGIQRFSEGKTHV